MTQLSKFDNFLASVDLSKYRRLYSTRIVEMDLPKKIQAIELLYKVYWDEKNFIDFEPFYQRYFKEKKKELEDFRKKITMCEDCYYRGIKARIYRTWASLITQIHAGYVAESVFGKGTVSMSRELDSKGSDVRVVYKKHPLNYQVKKTSYSGVMSRRPLPRKGGIDGEPIDIKYEVPSCLSDPKTKSGEFRVPYLRFLEDKRTRAFKNGFVVFSDVTFLPKKKEIDLSLK